MIDDSKSLLTDNTITSDIKILAEAKSLHNREANKIWIFAATTTLAVVSVQVSTGNSVQIFGINMDSEIFYPASAFLLVMLNILYASAHLQANKTSDLFHNYLSGIKAEDRSFVKDFSLADAAHTLYSANFNRIYPITSKMPKLLQSTSYLVLKFLSDFLLAAIPATGLIYSVYRTNSELYYFPILAIASSLSLLVTFVLLTNTLKYTIKRFSADLRN